MLKNLGTPLFIFSELAHKKSTRWRCKKNTRPQKL